MIVRMSYIFVYIYIYIDLLYVCMGQRHIYLLYIRNESEMWLKMVPVHILTSSFCAQPHFQIPLFSMLACTIYFIQNKPILLCVIVLIFFRIPFAAMEALEAMCGWLWVGVCGVTNRIKPIRCQHTVAREWVSRLRHRSGGLESTNFEKTFAQQQPLLWTTFNIHTKNTHVINANVRTHPHSIANLVHDWRHISGYLCRTNRNERTVNGNVCDELGSMRNQKINSKRRDDMRTCERVVYGINRRGIGRTRVACVVYPTSIVWNEANIQCDFGIARLYQSAYCTHPPCTARWIRI